MIDVDFEWFDPDPEIDFHGIKALLRQLLDIDHHLIDLSALSDLILTTPTIGSTVKCDGKESDPFALVTVLRLNPDEAKPAIQSLSNYLSSQASKSPGSLKDLATLLKPESKAKVGLIVSERLINMPHQIVPSLYSLLVDEIQEAKDESQRFDFTHLLVLSRTYVEVESQLDVEDSRPQKKNKAGSSRSPETFYFHPEDEVIHKHALDVLTFEYTKQGDPGASDARRTFQELGVRPQGHLMLLEAGKLPTVVKAIGDYLGGES